jgi:hypothetical protein
MKKIILALAMIFTLQITTAFAGNDNNVSQEVLNAFKSEFTAAKEVQWTNGSNFYRADFVFNGQHVFAYYGLEGNMMGVTRFVELVQLPIQLQTSLKKNYTSFWMSDLFEVASSENSGYFITLENASQKIVLKSADKTNWTVYQKTNKI